MAGGRAGHAHIDFLRLDVEGWEWETFRAIIRDFTVERASPAPTGGTSEGNNANKSVWGVPEREGVLPFAQLHC